MLASGVGRHAWLAIGHVALIVADPHEAGKSAFTFSRRKRDPTKAPTVSDFLCLPNAAAAGVAAWLGTEGPPSGQDRHRVIVLALAVLWTRYQLSSDRLIRDTASMRMAPGVAVDAPRHRQSRRRDRTGRNPRVVEEPAGWPGQI